MIPVFSDFNLSPLVWNFYSSKLFKKIKNYMLGDYHTIKRPHYSFCSTFKQIMQNVEEQKASEKLLDMKYLKI